MEDDSNTKEDFTWPPDLTIKFIHMRLQHDWLFQKRKQSWSTLHAILMENSFPKCITVKNMRKKWSNLSEDYKRALRKKTKKWAYFDVFHSYLAESNCMEAYPSWTNDWLEKFIEIRSENESYFNGNERSEFEGWNCIEKRLRKEDLPNECSVQYIDKMWASLIKTYRMRQDSGGKLKYPWSLYKPMKRYFDTYNISLHNSNLKVKKKCEDSESESDNECLSKLKLNLNKSTEESQQPDIEYEEDNFKWTTEWTKSLIHIRLQNDELFKHKKHPWKQFHEIMMDNGFPENISVMNVRRKWASVFEEYQKAVTLNNTKWLYYDLIHSYVGDDNSMDTFKNWSDDWIKRLIKLRIKHTLLEEDKRLNEEKIWNAVEVDLRNAKIPLECNVRNIQSMWTSLTKTFKLKHKLAIKKAATITWPFYHEMMLYYEKCEPKISIKITLKDAPKSDNVESDNDVDNSLFDIKDDHDHDDEEMENKESANVADEHEVKKELLNLTCRTCMGVSDVMLPLFKSEDTGLCEKLMTIASIQISQHDNYPQNICQACANELNSAYLFKKKCEETDILMKSTWYKEEDFKVIKVENVDNDLNNCDDFDDNRDDLLADDSYLMESAFTDNELINSRVLSKPYDVVIKKCKRPQYKRKSKRKIIRRTRIGSKNLIYIPIVNESGETVMKKKYVYFKVCDICGKSTQRMTEHMRMHSDEKTLKCPQCPKMFKSTPGLQSHVKTHSETPLKICQLCGREFYRDKSYKRHLIYHANERKYKCDSCDKSFNTREILVVHQRLHTGERPFSCKTCGKSFVTSGCVSRHQKVHRTITKLTDKEVSV